MAPYIGMYGRIYGKIHVHIRLHICDNYCHVWQHAMWHILTYKLTCMFIYMHIQDCIHGRIHYGIYATYMYMYEKGHIPCMECITSTYMCIYWRHTCSHVCHTYMWHISFFRMGLAPAITASTTITRRLLILLEFLTCPLSSQWGTSWRLAEGVQSMRDKLWTVRASSRVLLNYY